MPTDTATHRRKVVVTLTVEHLDGPYAAEDWEQDIPYVIEEGLLDADSFPAGVHGTRYHVTGAAVDDVIEDDQ